MKSQESFITTIKVWLFPTVVTVLSMMIWHDVRQIQDDVKALMAQSNIDKTRIDNLERRVDKLENAVLVPKSATVPFNKSKEQEIPVLTAYFIREEELHLPKPPKQKS